MVRALLEACGPVTSWKRMQDSDGRPKGFGFCEFKVRVFAAAYAHGRVRMLMCLSMAKSGLDHRLEVGASYQCHLDKCHHPSVIEHWEYIRQLLRSMGGLDPLLGQAL